MGSAIEREWLQRPEKSHVRLCLSRIMCPWGPTPPFRLYCRTCHVGCWTLTPNSTTEDNSRVPRLRLVHIGCSQWGGWVLPHPGSLPQTVLAALIGAGPWLPPILLRCQPHRADWMWSLCPRRKVVRLGLRLHENPREKPPGHGGGAFWLLCSYWARAQMGPGHDRYHRAITQATCRPY